MSPEPNGLPDDVLRALRAGELGRDDLHELLRQHGTGLLRLQFTDLLGAPRGVEVPASRLADVLEGGVPFDGSPLGASVRAEEADVLLRPDPATFRLLPWSRGRIATLVCDLHRADGAPHEGDPRGVLRRVLAEVEAEGYRARVAAEIEFFLLADEGSAGGPTAALLPSEGEAVRRQVVARLEEMGIGVASAHPDPGPGQQEIDLLPADALALADDLMALKEAARAAAESRGLRATFMPKPLWGENGSGLHLHHSLFRGEENAFADPEANDGLSDALRGFVGGLLRHARGSAAITNPLVNSYKRLVPGYAAPTYATWSLHDGSALARIPAGRGDATRCEVRLADPAANPYLALAVQLAAGLEGVRGEADPGAPVSRQTAGMSGRELQRRRIPLMPRDLGEALQALEEDRVVRGALGEYLFSHFVEAKRAEWEEYAARVHPWERERYLDV